MQRLGNKSRMNREVHVRFCEGLRVKLPRPTRQYFCGLEHFTHDMPLDPSSLVRWRKRIGPEAMEKLLTETIDTAKQNKLVKQSDVERVNVDTTVQEKAIAYPTDARLYDKMRRRLVREAKSRGIDLRQSYVRVGKKALAKQGRYSHAQQLKRANRETRRLKTFLGRVCRDLRRKCPKPDEAFEEILELAERLLSQKRTDKNKLYSVHAPEVECIAKGKVHKRYEFGCKVSVVSHDIDEELDRRNRSAPRQPLRRSNAGTGARTSGANHGLEVEAGVLRSRIPRKEALAGRSRRCLVRQAASQRFASSLAQTSFCG